ncbi:MAG: cysteine hydrolase family protein [Thermoplasmatales archaeon]|nr:cysteine hydrolase [Candidatus Thermoplasmatota archaeon]MCL6002107.1 cysteine hydrolase [Candidatus Thermoplasmatota archaeon]MDA8055274.1 cysteine hydrolase family protein [Thermoplasmatales archaeon]
MVQILENSVLVVIDVQKAWLDPRLGNRNNPGAEAVISKLITGFRKKGRKIIHVRHDSLDPESIFKEGKPTFEFKEEVKPAKGELVITKHVNSAFIGTNLESTLRQLGDPQVFYVGLVTDHCVSTTVRMSGNLGFRSYVIEDACATFDRKDSSGNIIPAYEVHKVNLASINEEFAEVVTSRDLII